MIEIYPKDPFKSLDALQHECKNYIDSEIRYRELIKEHDAEIRRQVGDELLKRINDKEYGIEKNNLWLISQINNICYGEPRICDLIEMDQVKGGAE